VTGNKKHYLVCVKVGTVNRRAALLNENVQDKVVESGDGDWWRKPRC
jgi:hypothetical protein